MIFHLSPKKSYIKPYFYDLPHQCGMFVVITNVTIGLERLYLEAFWKPNKYNYQLFKKLIRLKKLYNAVFLYIGLVFKVLD